MSDEPLHEPFASYLIRACDVSGPSVPAEVWRLCFRGAQMGRGLGRPMGLSGDFDAWTTSSLVSALIGCIGLKAPAGLIAAAERRMTSSDGDLPPELRAEIVGSPFLPAMLATALGILTRGEKQ